MSNANISADRVGAGANAVALFGFIVLCFAAAAIGGLFPPDEWYRTLVRPSFAPPNWVFGPVWTVLYLMMAVAVWLVWKESGFAAARLAITAFVVQLLLNAAWTIIFFGWHAPGIAFLEIVALWLAIVVTMALFRRHSKTAALLLLPYLAWVGFASVLNYGFWSLNS